jgi:hypothetical protein
MNNRVIHHHTAGNLANSELIITAKPDANGYAHHYDVRVQVDEVNPPEPLCTVDFQDGLPGEVGTNGLTNEALIAILLDRLARFNEGPHRCRQNSLAITKLEEAGHWLRDRTQERLFRRVEGTMKP